jgi:hypothetical protein
LIVQFTWCAVPVPLHKKLAAGGTNYQQLAEWEKSNK